MKRVISLAILFSILMPFSIWADYEDLNEKGVQAYNRQAYDSSEQYFQEAMEENPESKIKNSHALQGRQDKNKDSIYCFQHSFELFVSFVVEKELEF